MAIKVCINGFGRIGRQVLRVIRDLYPDQIDVVAFNDLGDLETMAHLFRHDSNYGNYPGQDHQSVKQGTCIAIKEKEIDQEEIGSDPGRPSGTEMKIGQPAELRPTGPECEDRHQ